MASSLPDSRSASARRRLQQREGAQRAILDATQALLVEEGYERFSMRKLAERCGYTAPTIYHYFGDKAGLIDALLEERFGQLEARARAVPHGDDPVEALRAIAHDFVRFGLENPTHYRLLSVPRPDDSPPPASAERVRSMIEDPIARLAAEGRLATDDVEAAMQFIWASIHGLVAIRISRPDYEWADNMVGFSLEAMLRGLVGEPDTRARSERDSESARSVA